ncbi:hypothetical protein O9G_002267 [Rozella allomycis CSF55]|uniref:FYR N-terminal domain-containing protein n=1 Tax=Rozella allomycis (strain CSF55) TaxID=988480 RepID=A0A075B110_ROZAC|nr:hypothetical protein O9G_002267 [Rozella allomycis CSF55]|eukprot:EPZ36201.1 hypothetical protein O9G_002267 [Rozella allomycis CSF55]
MTFKERYVKLKQKQKALEKEGRKLRSLIDENEKIMNNLRQECFLALEIYYNDDNAHKLCTLQEPESKWEDEAFEERLKVTLAPQVNVQNVNRVPMIFQNKVLSPYAHLRQGTFDRTQGSYLNPLHMVSHAAIAMQTLSHQTPIVPMIFQNKVLSPYAHLRQGTFDRTQGSYLNPLHMVSHAAIAMQTLSHQTPMYAQHFQPNPFANNVQVAQMQKPQSSEQSPLDREKPVRVKSLPRNNRGEYVLPVVLGKSQARISIDSLGHVICDKPFFHTEKYIYPVGYHARRKFTDLNDPSIKDFLICSISEGADKPIFSISETSGQTVATSSSPQDLWRIFVTQLRSREAYVEASEYVSTQDFFGLDHPSVHKAIQEMPNAMRCSKYKMLKMNVDCEFCPKLVLNIMTVFFMSFAYFDKSVPKTYCQLFDKYGGSCVSSLQQLPKDVYDPDWIIESIENGKIDVTYRFKGKPQRDVKSIQKDYSKPNHYLVVRPYPLSRRKAKHFREMKGVATNLEILASTPVVNKQAKDRDYTSQTSNCIENNKVKILNISELHELTYRFNEIEPGDPDLQLIERHYD